MLSVFFIPGFSYQRTFNGPDFDLLRKNMTDIGQTLHSIESAWNGYGIQAYGRLAIKEMEDDNERILVGHSLGAIVALTTVEHIRVSHLVLCSPSALFSEDLDDRSDRSAESFLGHERIIELLNISASQAASTVNRIKLPTTIMFGEVEKETHPKLVARSLYLANNILGSELIEIAGANHSIRDQIYSLAVAGRIKTLSEEII